MLIKNTTFILAHLHNVLRFMTQPGVFRIIFFDEFFISGRTASTQSTEQRSRKNLRKKEKKKNGAIQRIMFEL